MVCVCHVCFLEFHKKFIQRKFQSKNEVTVIINTICKNQLSLSYIIICVFLKQRSSIRSRAFYGNVASLSNNLAVVINKVILCFFKHTLLIRGLDKSTHSLSLII